MKVPLNLELLSEKTLPQKADPRLLSYCPSMDLLALGSTDQQVLIYRLNGQRVYGASQKAGTVRVNSISWKPNGTEDKHINPIDAKETNTSQDNSLPLLGVMDRCDWSVQRAVKQYINSTPVLKLPVSRAWLGHATARAGIRTCKGQKMP